MRSCNRTFLDPTPLEHILFWSVLRSWLFRVVTHCRVVCYRWFVTAYQSHRRGSSSLLKRCPETSAKKTERCADSQKGGSLVSFTAMKASKLRALVTAVPVAKCRVQWSMCAIGTLVYRLAEYVVLFNDAVCMYLVTLGLCSRPFVLPEMAHWCALRRLVKLSVV